MTQYVFTDIGSLILCRRSTRPLIQFGTHDGNTQGGILNSLRNSHGNIQRKSAALLVIGRDLVSQIVECAAHSQLLIRSAVQKPCVYANTRRLIDIVPRINQVYTTSISKMLGIGATKAQAESQIISLECAKIISKLIFFVDFTIVHIAYTDCRRAISSDFIGSIEKSYIDI